MVRTGWVCWSSFPKYARTFRGPRLHAFTLPFAGELRFVITMKVATSVWMESDVYRWVSGFCVDSRVDCNRDVNWHTSEHYEGVYEAVSGKAGRLWGVDRFDKTTLHRVVTPKQSTVRLSISAHERRQNIAASGDVRIAGKRRNVSRVY